MVVSGEQHDEKQIKSERKETGEKKKKMVDGIISRLRITTQARTQHL